MDNRINEIRRKISLLRSDMPDLEARVRDQVNRGIDCTEASVRLIGMRRELARLIGAWKAAGGGNLSLHLPARGGPRALKRDAGPVPLAMRR